MFVDVTKRNLQIPVKFLPYLEKYNIYALFHEVARQLAIHKPVDHVNFIHSVINHAASKSVARQVILLSPPFLNMVDLAKRLSDKINVTIITSEQIFETFTGQNFAKTTREKELAKWVKKLILTNHSDCKRGWLLLGYPTTKIEATALQQAEVSPTHVLNFVPSFMASTYSDEINMPQEWINYRKHLIGLREVLSKKWHDISMSGRDISEIMHVCLNIMSRNERLKYSMTPRVLIIGCPGSGYKTIAKVLQEKLGIVHVHFPTVLARAILNIDPAFNDYKELKTNPSIDASKKSRLHLELLMKILLDRQCVEKGWVVTGFPNTLQDMKRLDKTDTPPNRIIFFDCSQAACLLRLNKTSKPRSTYPKCCDKIHFEADVTPGQEMKEKQMLVECKANIELIKKYCGTTASTVQTDQSCPDVINCVLRIIMQESPISLTQRDPYEVYERPVSKKSRNDDEEDIDELNELNERCLECPFGIASAGFTDYESISKFEMLKADD